jgi:hypothetical protein
MLFSGNAGRNVMKKTIICSLALFLSLAPRVVHSAGEVGNTSLFHSERLGLTVVSGEIDLPSLGSWEILPLPASSGLSQVGLYRKTEKAVDTTSGRRFQGVERKKKTDMGRYKVSALYGPLRDFAVKGDGHGPSSFSELDDKRYGNVLKNIGESPWKHSREGETGEIEGPFVYLIPKVLILEPREGGRPAPRQGEKVPILLELRPYVDDGRHWVTSTDGRTERVTIDEELMKELGVVIRPVVSGEIVVAPPGAKVAYHLGALVTAEGDGATTLTVRESVTGATEQFVWKTAGASPGDETLLALWARGRAASWRSYLSSSASVLRYWLARHRGLYGLEGAGELSSVDQAGINRGGRRGQRGATAFNLLGGRAAVRETLQMQDISGEGSFRKEERTVELEKVEGVTVESHPFEEMLAGEAGGRLPLADHVPEDRFFAYFTGPSALLAFLGDGADFVFRAGALFLQNSVEYGLKDRYFGRLGLSEEWVRKLLEAGAVEEIALTTPDLFFIDGTDVTILARAPALSLLKPLLALAGVKDLGKEGITTLANAEGRRSYWAVRDDLLVISTSRSEAEKVLALGRAGGEGSLGRSAEFRYMLTKLPLKKETRAYAYFSDPFIRRMVGPEVKIGQLRRMAARGEMEAVTAGSLLALLDSGGKNTDLASLGRLGYVPKGAAERYSLGEDLTARSEIYGTVKDMKTLQEVPLGRVSPSEVKAYDAYRQNYTRFWRRFFDPIALRLDDAPDSSLEMTTFILPLLDATIYDGLREHLITGEDELPLNLPVLDPKPVMTFSLNMDENFWVKATGWWTKSLRRFVGFDTAIFDTFGPGIHLAVQDGDPIIVIGSGDMMGAFGGAVLSRGTQMMIPIVASVLTRPCRLFIELQDEKILRESLRRSVSASRRRGSRGSQVSFHQVGDGDSWVYNFDIEGVVNFRLGVEVQGGYLIVSNLPWTDRISVTGTEPVPLNGARLALHPGSAERQLPGLFYSAARRSQAAALKGMSALYPLLVTTSGSPAEAAAKNGELFGFTPTHPRPGEFTWEDGRVGSTLYGSAVQWKHPPYRRGDRAFGLLQGMENLTVNMQLEEGGLRAATRWEWKEAAP